MQTSELAADKKALASQNIEEQMTTNPIAARRRSFGVLDFTFLCTSFAIASWCLLTGGVLGTFLPASHLMTACVIGVCMGTLIACFSVQGCTKYGIDQYVLLRAPFGINGVKFPVLLTIIIGLGWNTIILIMLASGCVTIVEAVMPIDEATKPVLLRIFGVLGVVITYIISQTGPLGMKILTRITTPLLLFIMIVMFYMLFTKVGMDKIFATQPTGTWLDPQMSYFMGVELLFGLSMGWWPFLGALGRMANNNRAYYWGFWTGNGVIFALMAIVGGLSGLVLNSFNPPDWMIPLGGFFLGLVCLGFLALANISSTVIQVYPCAMAAKQFDTMKNKNWKILMFVCCIPMALVVALIPELYYDNCPSILAFCATFFAPMVGICIADLVILRKKEVDVKSLYYTSSSGKFFYWKGVNWVAILTAIAGFCFYFWILNPVTLEYGETSPFPYIMNATVPTIAFTCVLYLVLSKLITIPAKKGGFERN